MTRSRLALLAQMAVLVGGLAASGCGSADGGEGTSVRPSSGVSPSQSGGEWSALELAVLDRISEKVPGPKKARYEDKRKVVIVTIYHDGPIAAADLGDLADFAEEVSGGAPVEVVVSKDSPPTQ